MSGIEQAAAAFSADLNPSRRSEPADEGGPVERMFAGDVDDGEEAGGDDLPNEGEIDTTEADEGDGDEGSSDHDDDAAGGDGDSDESDDEPEGDEEEGDDDGSGSAGDDEVDLSREVEVTIDGEAKRVPLKEALEGYIRTQTFHKRLNEVNDLKKTVEQEAADVSKAREFYGNMLTALKDQLDSLTPAEPDWNAEYEKDPIAAARMERQWRTFKEQRAAIEGERQRVADEGRKEEIKRLNAYAAQERQKMLERRPEWKDEKVWNKDRTSMQRTAKNLGFSDAEINGILDSRYMEVLLRASKYDRMVANKPKPVQNGPKALRPGAGASRTAPKGSSKASARLAKTGSLRDAADVMKQFL